MTMKWTETKHLKLISNYFQKIFVWFKWFKGLNRILKLPLCSFEFNLWYKKAAKPHISCIDLCIFQFIAKEIILHICTWTYFSLAISSIRNGIALISSMFLQNMCAFICSNNRNDFIIIMHIISLNTLFE